MIVQVESKGLYICFQKSPMANRRELSRQMNDVVAIDVQ